MRTDSLLLMFHCREKTGYAIEKLEYVFLQAAIEAGFKKDDIYWLYNGLSDFAPNKIDCSYHQPSKNLPEFLIHNNIKTVLAFDLGYPCEILKHLKKYGVKRIISYWGASISSLNNGLKLIIKKIEYSLRKNVPDQFIFESEAMRKTATHGRGIPFSATSVINLGVDTHKYFPEEIRSHYTHDQFSLPYDTKIIFYSGHMEERKGVRVIIKAAISLIEKKNLPRIHFILCGNKGDEAQPYLELLENSMAKNNVTFAGYRNDIPALMRGSDIGVIASTGWDSFTMSSIEMMASGLPLIVSDLQGLAETIQDGYNGFTIKSGDHNDLAEKILTLCTDITLNNKFSQHSRQRAMELFSVENQITRMAKILQGNSLTFNRLRTGNHEQ